MSTKKLFLFILAFVFLVQPVSRTKAAEQVNLDYKGGLILDSDLDGLTDLGEEQIFQTNPNLPDTDGDGIFDGAEVLGETDPLDINDPSATQIFKSVTYPESKEVPWGWYISRASGLIAFALLYISIFLGVVSGLPVIRRFFLPLYSLRGHSWLSVQALIFATIHPLSLLFDNYLHLNLVEIFLPMFSPKYPSQIALGIISFYLIFALVLSSYLMRIIPQTLWRAIHFLNILLYLAVFFHTIFLGTDLQEGFLRTFFISANALLFLFLIMALISRIIRSLKPPVITGSNYSNPR